MDGGPITPTDHKVCTWTSTNEASTSFKYMTLVLQGLDAFNGGKQSATLSSAIKLTSASVTGGDEAYYLAVGDQVGLVVKKGTVAFKVAVYAKVPLANKETMELALAKDVLAKM